ncbi:hypothetical protein A1O3_04611 [Capronia epimyces CBS 606.96]|uniref:DUF1446 domain-containing protein n=1 Tax=Capronia epimyces CBS 606.96 TaxID=1182542 RepID=W9YNV6_9EURO|nr:uncharacterized protein A1O3_04611 [Capronia epimyces CBS 606.96]EXJ83944.1 hypothetical protein A1O3_04611 [Capronia epimyces CBS 606.96]
MVSALQHRRPRDERGTRPVRIANCSGGQMEPGWQMRKQASLGPVDFITGDWLAENNLAQEQAAIEAGTGEGFKINAWQALQQSMDVIAEKGIKVIIDGGGLNPQAMAVRCQELIDKHNYDLTVAFVSGDNIVGQVKNTLKEQGSLPTTFQDINNNAHKDLNLTADEVLACNAYIGARGILKGLENGADLIICGRVADASPVIGAAWWWYGWSDTDYDRLAGAFLAGHLIECSAYVSGSNFSGFHRFPLERFIDSGFPIAEVEQDGTCTITKHPGTNGMVTEETVKCQFLYEIQGNMYLNSDVKALLDNVKVEQVGEDRVRFSGIVGRPPPPTTKLAIYYKGGFESQNLSNAAGYATRKKYVLYEKQIRARMAEQGLSDAFTVLDFQVVGSPRPNPSFQLEATTYFRIFAQASTPGPLAALKLLLADETMQHFSGLHWSQDLRTADPKSFYVYYPCIVSQDEIEEAVHILGPGGKITKSIQCTRPPAYEAIEQRDSYDTANPVPLESFGSTVSMPLGNIALGRSGDKGSNINCGLFVDRPEIWEWFRSFLTLEKMKDLIGKDWKDEYRLERVEFPNIFAVHFVIYGILGRGVSSSTLLDNRGKGFTDYIRAKHVEIPEKFLPWTWKEDE